jgi:hypothetical protein
MRNSYTIFVGQPEGKRLLGRNGRRWKDNIEIYVRRRLWIGYVWLSIGTDDGLF